MTALRQFEIDELRLAADKAGMRGDHAEYARMHELLDVYARRDEGATRAEREALIKSIKILSEALRDIKVIAQGDPTHQRLKDIIQTATDALWETK